MRIAAIRKRIWLPPNSPSIEAPGLHRA